MGKAKYIITAITLVLLSTELSISAEKPISNTRQANCIVQVTIDKTALQLSFNAIESIFQSSGVKGQAALEILSADSDKVKVSIENQNDNTTTSGTFLCELNVSLSEDAKPAANEIAKALIQNLRDSLIKSFEYYKTELLTQIGIAQEQYKESLSILDKSVEQAMKITAIPVSENIEGNEKVYKELDKVVDLSHIRPEMSFAQVLDEIKKAAPTLNIQPHWRDLAEIPDIQPTTQAEMEPIKKISVSAAIDILLSNLGTVDCPLGYGVRDSVVLIASVDILPSDMETYIYEIPPLADPGQNTDKIIRTIQETIEPESWYDTSDIGYCTIEPVMDNQFTITNAHDVHKKVMKLLETINYKIPAEAILTLPVETLLKDKQELTEKKRNLETDLARLKAQIKVVNNLTQLSEIQVELAGKDAEFQVVEKHLDEIEKQIQAAANTDLKILKVRQSIKSVDIAEQRLNELEKIKSNMLPPQVIAIGLE